MEIRFPTDGDSPHWLAQFVFSRGGSIMNIEVVDRKGVQKCIASIPIEEFREAMAVFGCLKEIQTEQVIRVKDF